MFPHTGQHYHSRRQPVPSDFCAVTEEIAFCSWAYPAWVQEAAALPGCHSPERRPRAVQTYLRRRTFLVLVKNTIFFLHVLMKVCSAQKVSLFLLWNVSEFTRMWLLFIGLQACELKGKFLLTSSQMKGLSLGVSWIFTVNARLAGMFLLTFHLVSLWE